MIPGSQFHLEGVVFGFGSFNAHGLDRWAVHEQGHFWPDAASRAAPGTHDDVVLPSGSDANCLPNVPVAPQVPAARHRPALSLDGRLFGLDHNLRFGPCL